jgi:predicted nucleic acid-binding Zn ribbon protein
MNKIEDIGHIIKNITSDPKIKNKLEISNIFNHWEDIVGSEINKKSRPDRLTRGILFVSVINFTWANELSLMSDQLKKKINSYVGGKVVKSIRFKPNL